MSASDSRDRIDRERDHFFLTPLGVLRNGGEWPAPIYRHVIAACARWESESIVEWLVYHRSIGFDHVYLYCNDDDPAELYEAVLPFVQGDRPFVTFYHYRYIGEQYQMYRHFMRHHLHESEWLMLLDVDEFVCLPGRDDIATVSEEFGDGFDAVYLNWCSYGHNGHATRPQGSVLRNYTRREQGVTPFTKILLRNRIAPYDLSFRHENEALHHDVLAIDPEIRACNMLGETMAGYYRNFPDHAWSYLHAEGREHRLLQQGYIAHFNIRSEQDFVRRAQRGDKGQFFGATLWQDMSDAAREQYHASTNAVNDTYLSDYWNALIARGTTRSSVFPSSRWPDIGVGKPATQSSTLHELSRDDDARRALSGRLTGRPQNHTREEDAPWWMVDLQGLFTIHEIMLFNRLDAAMERLATCRIDVSHDRFVWRTVVDLNGQEIFGGLDGAPFRWCSKSGVTGRYVRLTIPLAQTYLQVDQIEIYGEPVKIPSLAERRSSNTGL